jgi:hypothetical protein
MRNLIRLAAAVAALAVAAPALPCGLMQETSAGKDQQPVVAQAPKPEQKATPKADTKTEAPKAEKQSDTVAKN